MKSLFKISWALLFVSSAIISCTENDDYDTIEYTDKIKIDSVKITKDTMSVYEIQSIKTFSTYTSKCEGFYGYDYIYSDEFTRTVSSFKFKTAVDCGGNVTHASQINFRPQQSGNYTFKFWNGTNSAGENIWIEKMIVVQ